MTANMLHHVLSGLQSTVFSSRSAILLNADGWHCDVGFCHIWVQGVHHFVGQSVEVFFSFIRKVVQKKSPVHPDSEHLHMLNFKNITPLFGANRGNYLNSLIINFVYFILILPGLYFMKDPIFNRFWFFTLILIYLLIYFRLYRLTKN